jgi:hypothetical protein
MPSIQNFLVLLLWVAAWLDVAESFCLLTSQKALDARWSAMVPLFTSVSIETSTRGNDISWTLPPYAVNQVDDGDDDDIDSTSDTGHPSPLHRIHIRPVLSEDEASNCCTLATEYATATGRWQTPDFDRHQTYATCDFPVEDCQPLLEYMDEIDFDGRLFASLSELYSIDIEDLSYLDLFVAHYQARLEGIVLEGVEGAVPTSSNIIDRLELHRDGSILSFSLLLNSPRDFEGGGTFYDALRDVEPAGVLHRGGVIRPERAGEAVLHCGKILHGADVVTAGRRTVLVGFVDVAERCQRGGVLGDACRDFGRMDVVAYRFKRQEQKGHKGWVLNNGRWLPKDGGSHSVLRDYVPAFSSIIRRSDPELCRRRRLEAEDILLRSILLPPHERTNDIWDGEITIIDDDDDDLEDLDDDDDDDDRITLSAEK